jgi:hypothetical protein
MTSKLCENIIAELLKNILMRKLGTFEDVAETANLFQ